MKKYIKKSITVLGTLVGLVALVSCNSEPNNVWLCGNLTNNTAVYWVNGEQHTLETPGGTAVAYAMIVIDNDVYVAGSLQPNDRTQQTRAAYWRNGKIHLLTDGTYASCAKAIAVMSSGDVITAGYAYDGPVTRTRSSKFDYTHRRMSVAKCWKNDTELYSLTNGKWDAACEDILIMQDSNIILVGYDSERNRFERFVDPYYRQPSIWLNGNEFGKQGTKDEWVPFHDGCGAFYTAFYNGIELRIAGYTDHNLESYGYNACYWDKDGWEKELPNSHNVRISSSCTDLADWYICGTSGDDNQGIYWKNGQAVKLTPDESPLSSSAEAIAVLKGDVYVAGTQQGRGGYWRNSKFNPLEASVKNMVGIHIREKQK